MYYITPNYSIAVNADAASNTLARSIIAAFYPEQETKIQRAAYPSGKGPDSFLARGLCPTEQKPTKPVVLIVRDPAERFRSALARLGLVDVDAAIDELGRYDDERRPLRESDHFHHQHLLAKPSARVFRLENLDAAATLIGLSLPLPVINEAVRPKPTLTPEQANRVLAHYAIDQAMYDAIPSGGMTYTPSLPAPPSPPVPQSISARQIRLWLVQHGVSLATVEAAIDRIQDAVTRESVRVEWEYAPYVERTHAWLVPMAKALGMSEAQVDAAFREAVTL